MRVAFRLDASQQIGIGHVMRCLTLADALRKRGAHVRFVSRQMMDHLQQLLERTHEFVRLPDRRRDEASDDLAHAHWLATDQATDASDTVDALDGQLWDWVVVDHYALDARWERAVRGVARHLLVIDDLADRTHDCDLLLDQNFYVDQQNRYAGKTADHCGLLLGPRYALLREEFRRYRPQGESRVGAVARVLVCFGGVDADNYTAMAIEALASLPAPRPAVDVVIGAGHCDRAGIESACRMHGFVPHVQSSRMAELMAAADLAVGAGGSTTWERCCLGLPSVVFAMADNQQQLVRDGSAAGIIYAPDMPPPGVASDDASSRAGFLARHLRALMENSGLRQAISRRGMEFVDGGGVDRVIRRMGCVDVEVRKARAEDSGDLFEWRNHPSIRAVSGRGESIDWATHQQWLAAVLADPDRQLLIGLRRGMPVGVVRFDIEDGEAEVSIYLVPSVQPVGTGSMLLGEAERWLVAARADVRSCRAHVLGHNVVSHRLFVGAGYHAEFTSYRKALGT